MSFIGDMIAPMVNPDMGAGFQATTSGTAQPQQDTAFQNTQTALQQQQSFLNSLSGQNGLGNQSSVFNQQQNLANQLGNLSQGIGPNPAQAQLAQNTAANTANQAALMAGQRGSSQNTGLIARQAAQQGAQNQQGAIGQAATLQAQQQLAAMQQLQNQQASMGNLAGTQVGQQQAALNAYNQTALGQQGNLLGAQANQNQTNAEIARGNQQGQQNIVSGLFGGLGGALSLAEGGPVKMASGGNPLMQPVGQQQVNLIPSTTAQQGPQSNVGKFMSGAQDASSQGSKDAMKSGYNIGSGIRKLFGSSLTPQTDANGYMPEGVTDPNSYADQFAPESNTGSFGGVSGGLSEDAMSALSDAGEALGPAVAALARGGRVPALVSPGEQSIPPKDVRKVAEGKKNPLKAGERIPGKPKHPGNDYRNDTVKRNLEEGGIVIPNSIMQSKDAEKKAIEFVRDIIAKNRLK